MFTIFYERLSLTLFYYPFIGVDDMFVLVACWDKLTPDDNKRPLNERIGKMLKTAGVSITVTTVTDVLAFFVGSTTVSKIIEI